VPKTLTRKREDKRGRDARGGERRERGEKKAEDEEEKARRRWQRAKKHRPSCHRPLYYRRLTTTTLHKAPWMDEYVHPPPSPFFKIPVFPLFHSIAHLFFMKKRLTKGHAETQKPHRPLL
jgi:hypothetical protein